jgi:hypothetical protein
VAIRNLGKFGGSFRGRGIDSCKLLSRIAGTFFYIGTVVAVILNSKPFEVFQNQFYYQEIELSIVSCAGWPALFLLK